MQWSNAKIASGILIAVIIGLALAIIIASIALAAEQQQRRFYDARGNSVGTASTDSQGTTTFRDARGNVIAKETKSGSHKN